MEERFSSPYLTMRRADLQRALLERVRTKEQIKVTTGFRVSHFNENANGQSIAVSSKSGEDICGDALIGADGLWSQTREFIQPDHPLKFSGKTAWRTLVPLENIAKDITQTDVGLWLGPSAHLVHYPVVASESAPPQLNIVAIIDDVNEYTNWSAPGHGRDLLPHFKTWGAAPVQLISSAENWRKWSLFEAPKLDKWHEGLICLMGDAAHPVLPFLAQGGGLAIEDAFILANLLAAHRDNLKIGFAGFEALRKSRCSKVQSASRKNGTRYHMKYPFSMARDFVIKRASPSALLGQYDWLYGYDGELTE